MKINSISHAIFLGMFIQGTLIASAEPAQKPLAPVLKRLYEKVQEKLEAAKKAGKELTAAGKKEAEDAIERLGGATGRPEAKRIADLLAAIGNVKEEAEKREEIKEELKWRAEEKEKAEALTKIPVRMRTIGKGYGNATNEEIDLNENEPLITETYAELLERQKGHNEPLILARVVTHNPDGTVNVHYFEAFTFNQARFGTNYPLSGVLRIMEQNNPINRARIDEVRYFSLDPNKPEDGFKYQFSENAVINDPKERARIDASQNLDEARKEKAMKFIAGEHVEEPIPQREDVLMQPRFPGAGGNAAPENGGIRMAHIFEDLLARVQALDQLEQADIARAAALSRTEVEDKALRAALKESKKLEERAERKRKAREEAQLKAAMARSLKEKEDQATTAIKKKAVIDDLLTLQAALEQNNKNTELKYVEAAKQAINGAYSPRDLSVTSQTAAALAAASAALEKIDGTNKITFYGGSSTLAQFTKPIIMKIQEARDRIGRSGNK